MLQIKTFVLTLKETPERTRYIVDELNKQDIPHQLYFGFHGKQFGLATTVPWDGQRQWNKEMDVFNPYFMTPGQLGCAMSHLCLWKTLQYLPDEQFLILEDDACPIDNFWVHFYNFMTALPPDWELAYLGNQPSDTCGVSTPVNAFVGTHPKPYCTHAYVLKKTLIPRLIEGYTKLREAIDIYLVNSVIPNIKCYVALPQIVTQKSLDLDFDKSAHIFKSSCRDYSLESMKTVPVQSRTASNVACMSHLGVALGEGWYLLEKNFRWSSKESPVYLYLTERTKIEIEFTNPKPVTIRIELSDGNIEVFGFPPSSINNPWKISLELEPNITHFVIKPTTFVPYDDCLNSTDRRELGICVFNFYLNGVVKPMASIVANWTVEGMDNILNNRTFTPYIKSISTRGDVELGKVEKDVPNGKINMDDQVVYYNHRSGWAYAADHLMQNFHHAEGVKFYGFVEQPFLWEHFNLKEKKHVPITNPWCGFIHIPWDFPDVGEQLAPLKDIVQWDTWKESMAMCKGLWTLSQDLANRLRPHVPPHVPISTLYHPTEIPTEKFSMEKFRPNPQKLVVSIGHCMRNMSTIHHLNVRNSQFNYIKTRLVPITIDNGTIQKRIEREELISGRKLTLEELDSVANVKQISNADYDKLLTQNVVFLDLFAASANNIVIECIARGTPLLINPLSPVVEYLGYEYPFYYTSLEEAALKLENEELIAHTSEYLMTFEGRDKISIERFTSDFVSSAVYQNL
jgi:GR25 family glycosyltransferase involved in LPS biosynthesis